MDINVVAGDVPLLIGLDFMDREKLQANKEVVGTSLTESGVEAHKALGSGERYHAPERSRTKIRR